MAAVENSEKISFKHGAKIFRRHLFDWHKDSDTRVVYQDVDPAEFYLRQFEERFNLGLVTNIAHNSYNPALTQRHQLPDRFIDLVSAAGADANMDALSHESVNYAAAYSLGAAGYDCNFARDFHPRSFVRQARPSAPTKTTSPSVAHSQLSGSLCPSTPS